MSIRQADSPELFQHIQESNLIRQYDLLNDCIKIGLEKGIEFFDKYTLWSLNAAAISNIAQFGGRYRECPIYVGNHLPPHHEKVPDLMDQCLSVVHENWRIIEHPTELAAYVLWRLNWIHPFIEGNGRTARSACYYILCMHYGQLLPGRKIVPQRIRENRQPYYDALMEADDYWHKGQYNVERLAKYLEDLLIAQLNEE